IERVLLPETAGVLSSAFTRMRPALSLKNGSIESHRVDAVVCGAKQECFSIRLDDPTDGCAGESAGPFCLTFPDVRSQRPTADEIAVLRAELAPIDGALVWRDIVSVPRKVNEPSPGSLQSVIAIALALLVLPCAAGAGAGI